MAGSTRPPSRPGVPASRITSMRPPSNRPVNLRAQAATPTLSGRVSPAESVASVATNATRVRSPDSRKRKERDFDAREDTNINVVVRCRGRNDREVRENSGVVVSTDGVKGKTVELSMGPSALSNKTYNFDRVFSPAADQQMVFDEVVAPIMDDVLNGFNCTIFAYGQTGTGKTYTMSGDITDMLPLPDTAGIVPRVLHALFGKLESEESENSVKCSFIELYNEELRDLLAADDNVKLKLFEDNSKKGHSSTLVQGMEESHINNASKGIQLLREGSHKRQVAATKCNDLSSRSHTVFTITVYMKRTSDTGEDFVSAGKLNLVDLAGSENIQRSGAENKRAAEAGLINKSLLTLGRVINALVDKSSHIPYRESKLTRLLQDSLGGRTKTCIIATLSPAKSNLEETISTLDYAFRAKNIRNKPQINQMVSKKTLFKEFTGEIEKLKMELIATRQRNGVYLAQETYENLTTESESRRILVDEQKDKIETMETNLRNKVQELFNLTTNLTTLKKDHEATRTILDGTKSILEKTEVVLEHTRQSLSEESALRKAHAKTEEELANIGQDLISTLGKTTSDIGGLHSKLRRRSNLQSINKQQWSSSQAQVSGTTNMVEDRISGFQSHQEELMAELALRMQGFVQDELQKLGASQSFLQEKMAAFEQSEKEVNEQTAKSKDDMNDVLEEIKTLREEVKEKVGSGLNDLSAAAERISAGIVTELESFHTQLHSSYATLGRDFKGTFDDLIKQLNEQQGEADSLRKQISAAGSEVLSANKTAQTSLASVVEEEKQKAAAEREELLAQMAALISSTAAAQEQRLAERLASVGNDMNSANTTFETATESYNQGMDGWVSKSSELVSGVIKSRENVKTKIKADFAAANEHTTSLRQTTASVHEETVSIVNTQMENMDSQLHSLDDIVTRVRAQNDVHHANHTESLSALASNVQASYSNIGEHFNTSFSRIQDVSSDMEAKTATLQATLPLLAEDGEIRGPLRTLREEIEHQALQEYAPTGETPQVTKYTYPTALPRTEGQDSFLSKLRNKAPSSRSTTASPQKSPSKGMVFTDIPPAEEEPTTITATTTIIPTAPATVRPNSAASDTSTGGLREIDPNTINPPITESASAPPTVALKIDSPTLMAAQPPLKRQHSDRTESKLPMKKKATRMTVAGAQGVVDRENLPQDFSKSMGVGAGGRRLRSHGGS
ncbi:putative kinesin-ii 85 kda subunit protein [Neofusicoccum parvum UCRNP2]|uniref:Putative kinesin-ii 85 kDa subunit protein n=1 Tax=Botryosphaeria parva (strain UCR-NP2) TaxID=1287680 RepID=R1G9N6_BOTPV|nr:putative kinesin-ii 85 kda subunit protein [Neofusicoccum parvum UCRNP2]